MKFTKNDEVFKNEIFADPYFDSEKLEFNDIIIVDYLMSNITNFCQELKSRCMKDQGGLFIQYYYIKLLFQKLLLVTEALILHYQKNKEFQRKDQYSKR